MASGICLAGMRSVDLKVLKNKLSEYIRFASTGETSWSLTAIGSWLRSGRRSLAAGY